MELNFGSFLPPSPHIQNQNPSQVLDSGSHLSASGLLLQALVPNSLVTPPQPAMLTHPRNPHALHVPPWALPMLGMHPPPGSLTCYFPEGENLVS